MNELNIFYEKGAEIVSKSEQVKVKRKTNDEKILKIPLVC